ncbi:MAG: septum formation protein Maf [Ruminococcaceae bacterium]|nr:septum formation protein Maf [Oscillospiraceae bacterium]
MKKLILASASPRRKEIFEKLGLVFEIKPSAKEPPIDENMNVKEMVLFSAQTKAEDIFEKNPDALVVGADTVVAMDGRVLGKPCDEIDAVNMLKTLSGRKHMVYTGVFVCSKNTKRGFVAETEVEFYNLSDDEIADYVKSGEPLDKAGSYGIQGGGIRFVKGICGDYYNVVGFPAAEFVRNFAKELKND